MFGGKFNPEEVEAIERTLDALDINSNQMVREAVAFWMMIRPPLTIMKRTHFDELLNHKIWATIVDHTQLDPVIQKFAKKYGESAFDNAIAQLKKADENYHALEKKKKLGRRPSPKRKRGKPKR
tara:strand:- start:16 stop:387 length:372 start_codon:yes stop_codon:yes gene_type:complete